MKLFHTERGIVFERDGRYFRTETLRWDQLFESGGVEKLRTGVSPEPCAPPDTSELRPPLESQEVWGAGVTYDRSKTARMEEASDAGGSDFYDRVYVADRPELFFKATPSRTVGPDEDVRIRTDSEWSVPEPELALAVDAAGKIFGYTVGNDVSARDIEGENPLYLPQAKVYDRSCALGPCILVPDVDGLPPETEIRLRVWRNGEIVFDERITLSAMRRTPEELVEYLFECNTFPAGCVLLTGTGIVPPDEFSLTGGESVAITIPPIGTLENGVIR